VLDYHWHPLGRSHEKEPHLHLGDTQLSNSAVLRGKDHLPTGWITFKAVIKSTIESGARPLRDDYKARLAEIEERNARFRSWSRRGPELPR
jgi:hypothetical protein